MKKSLLLCVLIFIFYSKNFCQITLPFDDHFSAISPDAKHYTFLGIGNDHGGTIACSAGDYVCYTSGNNGYMIIHKITVPSASDVKISFKLKKSASYSGTPTLYFRNGTETTNFSTPGSEDGWIKFGTATTFSCGTNTLTLPYQLVGGQQISIVIYFPGSSSTKWVAIDDLSITSVAHTITSAPWAEDFSEGQWYNDFGSDLAANTPYVKTGYRSKCKFTGIDIYLNSSGGASGTQVNYSGSTGNDYCQFYKGYANDPSFAKNTTPLSSFVTQEIKTNGCSKAELRFAFKSNAGINISDEDYTSHCPNVYYTTTDGYEGTWTALKINYYYANGNWWYASCDLPVAAKIKLLFEAGNVSITAQSIDDIKVFCRDCSLSTKTGGTISGPTTNLQPNTSYNYGITSTTGATYYKWFVKLTSTNPGTIYYGTTAGTNPAIISGQGTQNVTVNFGTTSGTFNVMCIPYDSDPGTDASPNVDVCYAKISVLSTKCISVAPVAISASTITSNSFTANWNSVTGATTYYIDVATDTGFTSMVGGYNNKNVGNVTSSSVSGLSPNTTYYYRVRTDAPCTSKNSNTISVTTINTVCKAPDIIVKANTKSDSLTICKGDAVNLTGNSSGGSNCSGVWDYKWSSGQTTVDVSGLNPAVSTTYTLTVSCHADASCSNTSQVKVKVNPLPNVTATANTSICTGKSITLIGSGATSYVWDNGVMDNVSFSPTTTKTYTVTGTDANGCKSTAQSIVTVNSNPTVTANTNSTICKGTSIVLKGSGASTYTWDHGVTDNVSFTPASTQTYTVTGTDANNCTNTAQTSVAVNSLPNAPGGINNLDCPGQILISATGGGVANEVYKWYDALTNGNLLKTNVNPDFTTPDITSNTDYYVTNFDTLTGCESSPRTKVTASVKAAPTAPSVTPGSRCGNGTVNLSASGINNGENYVWYDATGNELVRDVASYTTPSLSASTDYYVTKYNTTTLCESNPQIKVTATINSYPVINIKDTTIISGQSVQINPVVSVPSTYSWSNGKTTQNINVSPTVTTTYTVTVTSSAGACTSSASVTINVKKDTIFAYAGKDTTICSGKSATLKGLGPAGCTYSWSYNNSTSQNITVSPTTSTTYSLTVTKNGDTATSSVFIKVITVIADAGNDRSICKGDSITLSATGGNTYLWSSKDSTEEIIVKPLINKKYFVTVSLRGCSAVDSVWVIVNNLPKADAGKDTIVCNSSYLILRATGGISYQWNNGVSGVTNNIHPTSNSTYVVTVTDSNNCTASDDVVISVKNPKPDAGTNISSCNGTVVKLTASGGDRYSWNTGDTTTIINVKPSQNTTYTVTVNSAACSGTANVIVSVVNIHADAGKDTVICKGDILTLTASGGGNYSWSTSDTTSNIKITPLINTKYFLTATLNGCSSMDSISVSVKNLPIAKAGKDTIVCNGSSVTLTATGGKTYSWSNGATGTPVIVIPTSNMAYVVTVYDNNNCFAKDTVFVNVKNSFPSAGSNTVSCNGQIVKLTASGGGKYLWNTGDTTAIISILPLKMTTYSVTVTSGNCSGTSNVVVSVDSIKADAGSDITIVKDSSTTLNVAGGTYFKWSNGDTTSIIKVKPDSTTTYIVTISDNQGCSASDNVVVTVVPGNKTVSEMTVKIYPNPSKGAFKIKTDGITDKIITVIIYDVLGQIVFEDDEFKVYNGAEIEIRTDLGKGAYLLEIITQNDSVVQKLIID